MIPCVKGLEFALERTPCGRSLKDDDLAEAWEVWGELSPEPSGEDFDGGAFEPFDIVEVCVVELVEQRIHSLGDFLMVIDPADLRVYFAFDMDFDLEGVSMHLAAFMVLR